EADRATRAQEAAAAAHGEEQAEIVPARILVRLCIHATQDCSDVYSSQSPAGLPPTSTGGTHERERISGTSRAGLQPARRRESRRALGTRLRVRGTGWRALDGPRRGDRARAG